MKYYLLIPFLACFFITESCKRIDFADDSACLSCLEAMDTLRINQFQHIASHNSYRLKTYAPLYNRLRQIQFLSSNYRVDEWDYTHETIQTQLEDFNVRGFELDFYMDPLGGKFYERKGNSLIFESTTSNEPELLDPGLKMLHFADLDYMTNNLTLKSGLQEIKAWSDAHPNHLPIYIMMEPKEDGLEGNLPFPLNAINFTEITKFGQSGLDIIDDEIKAVFGNNLSNVITPDVVRGDFVNVNTSIKNNGWPMLKDARGKVCFIALFDNDQKRDYLTGHPSLENRAMFVFGEIDDPETAFVKIDDPTPNNSFIQALVRNGYFVRTRSDVGTHEARNGDYSRLNNGISSGAQMISTDYYRPDERHNTSDDWSDFKASFEDGKMFRLNPINTPSDNNECNIKE